MADPGEPGRPDAPATAPPPLKMPRRTLKQWLHEMCIDGELIKVLMLRNGTVCLQNERTEEVYFVG